MKYKKILVPYKKPLLDIYKNKSKELERLIKDRDMKIDDLEAELKEHETTKKIVKKVLKKDKSVKVSWRYRAYLSKGLMKKYDLIMPFGGDGTLIEASHYIYDNTPVFGINSDYRPDDPQSSEGFLLSTNKHDFSRKYNKLQSGKMQEYKFNRLQAELNGKKLEELILNDIAIGHKEGFGATLRLILKDKGIEEFHKSDGMIIATTASNWAILYSGTVLPVTSNKISYVVAGMYVGRLSQNLKLSQGITDCLEIYSKTREAEIKLDGKHIRHDFGLGAKLKVYPSGKPLTILGFDEKKRKFYMKKSK